MRDFETQVNEKDVVSYTCQSTKESALKKNKIEKIGDLFGIGKGEVLRIPKTAIEKHKGLPVSNNKAVAQMQVEALLRDLS